MVYIIDDEPSVRRGLSRLLRSAGFQTESFSSSEAFLELEEFQSPACLLVDLQMPGLSGLDLQARIAARSPVPSIVFLTGHGNVGSSVRAMKSGAVDFLEKPVDQDKLLEAVRTALEVDREKQAEHLQAQEILQRVELLTPREKEVFLLVITGIPNKAIAMELGTSEKTIKVHRGRVMTKMQAQSLAELVWTASRAGFEVESGPEQTLKGEQ
jgi:FixJ family two-component response regulator